MSVDVRSLDVFGEVSSEAVLAKAVLVDLWLSLLVMHGLLLLVERRRLGRLGVEARDEVVVFCFVVSVGQ